MGTVSLTRIMCSALVPRGQVWMVKAPLRCPNCRHPLPLEDRGAGFAHCLRCDHVSTQIVGKIIHIKEEV